MVYLRNILQFWTQNKIPLITKKGLPFYNKRAVTNSLDFRKDHLESMYALRMWRGVIKQRKIAYCGDLAMEKIMYALSKIQDSFKGAFT